MPEGPEVTILSQYLLSKLKNKTIIKFEVLSGKYLKKTIANINIFDNEIFTIKDVNSKGKLMWIELDKDKYVVSHLGLSGFWSFKKGKSDRIRITFKNNSNGKIHYLCYDDPRNFGNIEILLNKDKLLKKLDLLAMDSLKTNFTETDFNDIIQSYLKKSSIRKTQKLFLVLMKQNASDGIVSGLGNYLVAEILYRAKLSPYREMGSLTNTEINALSKSIKYVTKLSYYNNTTGYMTNFEDFITVHKKRIDNKKYPEYHPDIKLNSNDKFEFSVYRKKKDNFGNDVISDKDLNKGRTTYWVENIQK